MLLRAADQGQLAKWHSRGSIPSDPVSIIRLVHTTHMSTPHHEDMLLSFFDEEMASMKQSGMASLMTDAALIEHCEFIARQRFEDQLW